MESSPVSDMKHLSPGIPQTVQPGTVIRISYKFSPEACRALRDTVELDFVTVPDPFVPDTPPPPVAPPPGTPTQFGFNSPEDINRRTMNNFEQGENYKRQQWEQSHPSHRFSVQADVIPGENEGEGLLEGIVLGPKRSLEPQFGMDNTLYAGTYHLSPVNFFNEQPGESPIIQLSAEAQAEVESYQVMVEKTISPPPPPAQRVIEVTDLHIETENASTDPSQH